MIDKRLLNLLNLERFLIDLMLPSGRKTLLSRDRHRGSPGGPWRLAQVQDAPVARCAPA
jgi:hypothetical protein